MANKKKQSNSARLLLIWIPLVFILAIIIFLSSKDNYGEYETTGWEVLKMQWPSFWTWIVICSPIGLLCAWLAVKTETQGGSTGKVILLVILSLILLCGPWTKACTDKTNGGVTAPGYKSVAP